MSAEYLFDIRQIDDEHSRVDDLLEKLKSHQGGPYSPELTGGVLADLHDHTIRHFSCEEILMKITSFPGIKEHIQEHKKLINRIDDLLDQSWAEPAQSLGQDLIDIIVSGLISHTENFDRRFHEWFSSQPWDANDRDRFRGQIDTGCKDNPKETEPKQ